MTTDMRRYHDDPTYRARVLAQTAKAKRHRQWERAALPCSLRQLTEAMATQMPLGRALGIATKIELDSSGCWLFHGQRSRDGYGKVWMNKRRVFMHRVTYEALRGPIPDGLQLDHLCRMRACCNPAHLEPVTLQVNRQRGALAVTTCKRGHAFDEENTYRPPSQPNKRMCRSCARLRRARR